ncbi:MAG: MATE family efflux transporter, partial [Acidimicrobiia bacterium]|nr:MATE family efflux transporter [Acidimicrobiia bacterium]
MPRAARARGPGPGVPLPRSGALARLRPGPVDRDIFRLAIPAFATIIAEPVCVLTDTAIVGHLGTDQLAGLALASTILLTAYAVFIFLAYGTTAAVARLLGAGQLHAAAAQAVQGMWLALALGAASAAVVGYFSEPLVELLGGSGAVATNALVYLRTRLVGLPALLVTLASVGYLRGRLDTRTPLLVAAGVAVANLVVEVVLVYGFGFGIGAAALSTVLAQGAGALVLCWRVAASVRALQVSARPSLGAVGRLLVVGLHLLVRTAALRASLLLGTAMAARLGRDELAAYQVGFEIWSFLGLAMDALAIAAQALVGHALGAGDVAQARAVGRRVNELAVLAGLVLGWVVLVLRGPIAGVFSED